MDFLTIVLQACVATIMIISTAILITYVIVKFCGM